MGKIQGDFSGVSGRFGDNFVGRQTAHGTILAKRPRKLSTPRRSEKQVVVRGQMANVAANFRLYAGKLLQGFEGKPIGCSDYNAMVQVNYGVSPVYLAKQEVLNGGCVVAPYQYCRGTLRSIGMEVKSNGVLVSDIKLGVLQIGAQTTVAQLAAAVMDNNTDWENRDQLTFFYARQYVDGVSQVPRAAMDTWKVVLDSADDTLLLTKVSALGFASVSDGAGGYVLGMSQVLTNGGASWTHSREDANGNVKLGSQRLVVVNDILSRYTGTTAVTRYADSYGGITIPTAYLNPAASAAPAPSTGTGGTPSGGNGGTSGGSEED